MCPRCVNGTLLCEWHLHLWTGPPRVNGTSFLKQDLAPVKWTSTCVRDLTSENGSLHSWMVPCVCDQNLTPEQSSMCLQDLAPVNKPHLWMSPHTRELNFTHLITISTGRYVNRTWPPPVNRASHLLTVWAFAFCIHYKIMEIEGASYTEQLTQTNISNGAWCLIFGRTLRLLPYVMCAKAKALARLRTCPGLPEPLLW